MNKPVIIAFCVGLIGGVIAMSQLQGRDVYEVKYFGNVPVKINKQTGQTWRMSTNGWVEIRDSN